MHGNNYPFLFTTSLKQCVKSIRLYARLHLNSTRCFRIRNLRPHACFIKHVHYAGSGQSLHFLANRNPGLANPPLFWPVNCIKIRGHVALLSGPTVYSLYWGINIGGHVALLSDPTVYSLYCDIYATSDIKFLLTNSDIEPSKMFLSKFMAFPNQIIAMSKGHGR